MALKDYIFLIEMAKLSHFLWYNISAGGATMIYHYEGGND